MEKKRNIHVLPTPNPSRLFKSSTSTKLQLSYSEVTSITHRKDMYNIYENIATQNIYITNEEIKEGDWVLDDEQDIFQVLEINHKQGILRSDGFTYVIDVCEKIILTTDQDLIKDGVQAIDDEFLEWFVKNPSCEEVEIEQKILKLVHNPSYIDYTPEGDGIYLTPKSEDLQYGETLIEDNVFDYKIIIPKEKPKQVWEQLIEDCGGKEEFMKSAGLLPKQETLEEVAEIILLGEDLDLSDYDKRHILKAMINIAKWQQERMYSEEDIEEILTKLSLVNPSHLKMTIDGYGEFPDSYKLTEKGINYIIEQFKKK